MNKIDNMRYIKVLLLFFMVGLMGTAAVHAQESYTINDTIFNPKLVFNGVPSKYEIAGIKVSGVDNYEDYIIIGYSGLSIGQRIEIPGNDLRTAAKRFWRQGLFSKVQIKVEKIYGDKAWLEFALRQQPRISKVNFVGMKKGEQKDITERLGNLVGNQITPNIASRIEQIVQKYYAAKGFEKATCKVTQQEDLSKQNEVIVDIVADKHEKISVHKIYIEGNEVLSDGALKRTMKKTNESGFFNVLKWFSQKKFVRTDFEDDKQRIIDKYNEKMWISTSRLMRVKSIISLTLTGWVTLFTPQLCSTRCWALRKVMSITKNCLTSAQPTMTTPWPTCT